jgi:hypothetical protein
MSAKRKNGLSLKGVSNQRFELKRGFKSSGTNKKMMHKKATDE